MNINKDTSFEKDMSSLKILICGGGCAGPALAYFLARNGHHVTVIERSPCLRAKGAQIDLRAQAIPVIKKMGLLDAIKSKTVQEPGMSFVDSEDRICGTVKANTSGKGRQTMTSEFEIMRGDLVELLYDATKDQVRYVFGMTVDRFEQDDKEVRAYFSDGSSDTFDLLVGADGQGSRIRKAMLPPDAPLPYRHMGAHMAYWIIPREKTDSDYGLSYLATRRRWVMRRSHSPTETQVYFITVDDDPELGAIGKAPQEKQKEFWSQRFRDAGWQCSRFIEGMQTTENFYAQELVQVQLKSLHKGRVVLLGDAGYCPSPMTAMGTTGAFVGAYVLAGEICSRANDLSTALSNYDKTMLPLVEEMQEFSPRLLRYAVPESQWAINLIRFVARVLCFLRIPEIMARFGGDDNKGWKLPEYPNLKM